MRRKGLLAGALLSAAVAAGVPARGDSFVRWESGNVYAEITDLVRAVEDAGFRREIAAEKVELIGVWERGEGGAALARLTTHCCELEAVKISVGVRGAIPSEMGAGKWVRVVGFARFGAEGEPAVWIEAESVREEAEPDEEERLLRIER